MTTYNYFLKIGTHAFYIHIYYFFLREINISNSNIVLLLNEKYKAINKLSSFHVTFKGEEVVLLR